MLVAGVNGVIMSKLECSHNTPEITFRFRVINSD